MPRTECTHQRDDRAVEQPKRAKEGLYPGIFFIVILMMIYYILIIIETMIPTERNEIAHTTTRNINWDRIRCVLCTRITYMGCAHVNFDVVDNDDGDGNGQKTTKIFQRCVSNPWNRVPSCGHTQSLPYQFSFSFVFRRRVPLTQAYYRRSNEFGAERYTPSTVESKNSPIFLLFITAFG